MKQSDTYIKWFSRITFGSLLGFLTYAVSQPHYNSAHLVPHTLMRQFSASYESILFAEQNIDGALHLIGAAMLTAALWLSQLPILSKTSGRAAIVIALFCLAAEGWQYQIGRGWHSSDLLLGILGCFMAYLAISKSNWRVKDAS